MKLIVGLGNPGKEYQGTRHNVGFETIEILARRHQISMARRDFKAVLGEGIISDQRVLLVRPMTYMNASGEAVAALCRFYKLEPTDVIVILDEVALAVGRIRLRFKGSAGGHNGMASVIQFLHTQEVPRIRIGVGAPRPGEMVDHVLSRFRAEEREDIEIGCERAADAVEVALRDGFDLAMNRYNINPQRSAP